MSAQPGSRTSVIVTMVIVAAQAVVLGILAAVTGSAILYASAMFSVADLGVEVFLLIGLVRVARPADERHPLGYGQEIFFWSLFAAVGLFVGGGVASIVQGLGEPSASGGSYALGYLVIVLITVSDGWALAVSVRGLGARTAVTGRSWWAELLTGSDPAAKTVTLSNAAAVVSGPIALAGLGLHQATGDELYDSLGSVLIGILLVAVSGLLLRLNQNLIAAPSVDPADLARIRHAITEVPGVAGVRRVIAVIVGPHQVMVAARVTLPPATDLPAAERAMSAVEERLRRRPEISEVYLTPVAPE
ncbi:cation diffusion facilitator family transporter [Nonomuraea spiralis]|uniref:cation diffusion facilitator family transporter n=1 Tax=Nonomuraea spiralis TaxID=46182 RepID=UPI0037BB236D